MNFAMRLKQWRRRAGMSQGRLGLEADVSARHIAFIETGRANPSRAMVLRLSEALGVPRDERNHLLEAAGFAAAYAERTIDARDMRPVAAALQWTLQRHAPYPAMAFDRHWRLSALNAPATALLTPLGLKVGASLLSALLDPQGLRQAIENWPEVAAHLATRLRTESRHFGGDETLDQAASALAPQAGAMMFTGVLPSVIPTRYRYGDRILSLFSTIAQFATAEDIAVADLRIELLFPADEETRAMLTGLAEG